MGYLKKCWYLIRSLTYVRDDTIKFVTVEIYYCCSTMRFTIKTTLLPLFITQNRIGLKKRCFCHHWLGRGSRSKICLSTRFKTFPPVFRVYAAAAPRPEWQWNRIRDTVRSQASKTIDPCPTGSGWRKASGMNSLRILRLFTWPSNIRCKINPIKLG